MYMTFEANTKCLWQHPAKNIHLEITKTKYSEVSDPILLKAHSLRQLQPGNWKISFKPRTDELTTLLSALREFTKIPDFKNTRFLTRHLVKELIRQCESSVSADQATGPKWNKTNYN